jgi:hypothetical protein
MLLLLGMVIIEIHLFRLQKKLAEYEARSADLKKFLEG